MSAAGLMTRTWRRTRPQEPGAREAEPALGAGPGSEVLTQVLIGTCRRSQRQALAPGEAPARCGCCDSEGSKAWE